MVQIFSSQSSQRERRLLPIIHDIEIDITAFRLSQKSEIGARGHDQTLPAQSMDGCEMRQRDSSATPTWTEAGVEDKEGAI